MKQKKCLDISEGGGRGRGGVVKRFDPTTLFFYGIKWKKFRENLISGFRESKF